MGIPRVGALTPRSRGPPAPRGIPAPPAGALRALRDPLLGAGQLLSAATCSYGSFFRISPKKSYSQPRSLPACFTWVNQMSMYQERRWCLLGKMQRLFSLSPPCAPPAGSAGPEGCVGPARLPCPRPGAELRPQMRCDFTFGLVFPERHWNYGRPGPRSWLCAPPVVPAPSPDVERPRSPCKMLGAGSPRRRREPLLRLWELSTEGGETAT